MNYFVNKSIIARYFNLKEDLLGNFVIAEYRGSNQVLRHLGITLKKSHKRYAFIDLNLGQLTNTDKSCKIFKALVGCNNHHTLAENCANEARYVWDNKELYKNFFWYDNTLSKTPSLTTEFASKEFFSHKFNIPLELMFPVIIKYITGESIGYYINDEKHIIVDILKAQAITNKECLYFSSSEFSVHGNRFGTKVQNISLDELKKTYLTRWIF